MSGKGYLSALTLLFAAGTLMCCALPALLVMLGFGAVVASIVSTVPGIVLLSEYKGLVFSLAGFSLVLATWLEWRRPGDFCQIEAAVRAEACSTVSRAGRVMIVIAWLAFIVGCVFAFALPLIG